MVVLRSWELPDQWQFGYEIGKIGRSLAEGYGFSIANTPTAKFPPVYPFLVGGVFTILGVYSKASAVILFLFQSTCAALTAVCLAVLGARLRGWKEGLVAGLIWAIYPGSLFHSVVCIWYSELAIAMLLLLIILAIRDKPFSLFARIAGMGLLSGILILTNSTMSVYPILLLLWMLYILKVRAWKWIGGMILWGAAVVVVVTPWAIRNRLVMGNPGILKSNFGLELFFGNNPYSTGGGINEERDQALQAISIDEKEGVLRAQSEYVFFDYLQKQALEWIQMHPMKFLQLSIKRFLYFWGKFPSTGPGVWRRYTWIQLTWYAPVVLLSLFGIKYCKGRRRDFIPIWLFLLVYPLPFYITHVQLYRYRYPVEPFLVLLAAIPLNALFGYYWARLRERQEVKNYQF